MQALSGWTISFLKHLMGSEMSEFRTSHGVSHTRRVAGAWMDQLAQRISLQEGYRPATQSLHLPES
jgi:hypothetical protein